MALKESLNKEIDTDESDRDRLLILVPHLSTGGMPQYVNWRVRELNKNNDVYVVEYSDIAPIYDVQKKKIRDCIGDNLITLAGSDGEKKELLFEILGRVSPCTIYFQEFPETWLPDFISDDIYKKSRPYDIVETTHGSEFNPKDKRYIPDRFDFISDFYPNQYNYMGVPYNIVEYPIEKKCRPDRDQSLINLGLDPRKKHVLNVGLFTPGKNQSEVFKMASVFKGKGVVFHFVGNQASNFKSYWEPLMEERPSNCFVWGERGDVDSFYSCMDLFLFTSQKEANPIVIKEAMGWSLPIFMYNLHTYCGEYDGVENVTYLEGDIYKDVKKISDFLGIRADVTDKIFNNEDIISYTYKEEDGNPRIDFRCLKNMCKGSRCKAVMRELKTNSLLYFTHFEFNRSRGIFFISYKKREEMEGVIFEIYDPNDKLIFYEVVSSNDFHINGVKVSYDKGHIDFLKTVIPEIEEKIYERNFKVEDDDVVVDVGSHIGLFSLSIIDRDIRKCYCIEPYDENFKHLSINIKSTGMGDKFVLVKKAISDNTGDMFFDVDKGMGVQSESSDGGVSLPTISFMDFINDNNIEYIDFLKLDCEGGEYHIINSEANWDFLRNNVGKIAGEIHLREEKLKAIALIDNLINLGFSVILESVDGVDITNSFRGKVDYYSEIHFYAEKEKTSKVLIGLDSKSLGDTLAWMPYADEFRKKNNCKVVLSTFWNDLFKKEYPEIDFVNPGTTVNNIERQYNIGWYYPWNSESNPNDFRIIPLQKTSSDIPGLDFKEIKPKITIPDKTRSIEEKYVCIGIHSTCQSKYWNNPNGWQTVVDYLNSKGYKVVHISKERGEYMGNSPPANIIDKTGDIPISDRIIDIKYADMFIGIGSGLSWLSWAVGTPTVLISGFSDPFCEPKEGIERIHNSNVCNSCFNDADIQFDPGDWNWCPREKDFECSKSIRAETVIESIDKILKD